MPGINLPVKVLLGVSDCGMVAVYHQCLSVFLNIRAFIILH